MSEQVYNAFPTAARLAACTADDLAPIRLGYRAKYILAAARQVASGEVDLDAVQRMDYAQAKAALMRLTGVGVKVAECICLFALHHIDAFPVDTWIQKILLREYYPRHPRKYAALPRAALYPAIVRDFFGRYRGCQGIMQQYIFYYERHRDASDGPPSP